ncbi:MAG: hypothetical protein KY475_26275 [Planctomycetes bacterium]|nr:hypothetical protein [Planctomycetota bacterium]
MKSLKEQCRNLASGALRDMLNDFRIAFSCDSERVVATDSDDVSTIAVLFRLANETVERVSVSVCPDYRRPDPSLRVDVAGVGRKIAHMLSATDETTLTEFAFHALEAIAVDLAARIELSKRSLGYEFPGETSQFP